MAAPYHIIWNPSIVVIDIGPARRFEGGSSGFQSSAFGVLRRACGNFTVSVIDQEAQSLVDRSGTAKEIEDVRTN